MKTSPILCKCFSSVILHACFALYPTYRELPAETDQLLELLQIAFIRGSEDFSLIKPVTKARQRIKFFKRDPLEEEIDSNCLYAMLKYCR